MVGFPPGCAEGHADEIARLTAQLQIQSAVIRAQSALIEERRDTFERASAAAGIGLWECSLPDERLIWTGTVFDQFGLPRQQAPERAHVLGLYADDSRRALTALRNRAIAEGSGFRLDAEIAAPDGGSRWLRLTATVDSRRGVPVRLFGMKQDVTEEVERARHLQRQAETDAVTGLANRSRFEERLGEASAALLLIDLDGFKGVNDSFGHAAGDACLTEAASRLALLCREGDLVARIGGDEFAILLGQHRSTKALVDLAARIVAEVGRPMAHAGRTFRIGASVGVARGPGRAAALFAKADGALYAAKAAGRNTFRMFDAAEEDACSTVQLERFDDVERSGISESSGRSPPPRARPSGRLGTPA